MTHTAIPLNGESRNNQQLFSDHYLSVILPGLSDWLILRSEAQL